jgi:16S rRNA (guanine527-N7)-methyltransferase
MSAAARACRDPAGHCLPDLKLTLIETVEKKSAFQRQAKIELGLGNVEVPGGRVEDLPAGGFDAASRAPLPSLADFVRLAGHLPPRGHPVRDEGPCRKRKSAACRKAGAWPNACRCEVPGLDAQRHLLVLEKA